MEYKTPNECMNEYSVLLKGKLVKDDSNLEERILDYTFENDAQEPEKIIFRMKVWYQKEDNPRNVINSIEALDNFINSGCTLIY